MFQTSLPTPQVRFGSIMNTCSAPLHAILDADHIPRSKHYRLVRLAKQKAHLEQKLRKEAKWK